MTDEEETKTKKTSKEPVEIKHDPELIEYVYNQARAGRRLKKKAYRDTERK